VRAFLLALLTITLAACGEGSPAAQTPAIPAAVMNRIQQIQKEMPANGPPYLARYRYKGKLVYYIPPRCCDMMSELYDASGQLICHPDGGFTGLGDRRCGDFLSQRTEETILWRNP
jgi:hypothetical protein